MKRKNKSPLAAFALASSLHLGAPVMQTPAQTTDQTTGQTLICNDTVFQTGIASVYHDKFENRTTANGENFSQHDMTAAHKTLPFDTLVEVTDTTRNTSTIVRINDRGPFVSGRIIDLSDAARRALGDTNDTPGLHNVQLRLCHN